MLGLSGESDKNTGVNFLKNDADDYMIKPLIDEEFICRVQNTLSMVRNIQTLREMATTGYLTKASNPRQFFGEGEKSCRLSKKGSHLMPLSNDRRRTF